MAPDSLWALQGPWVLAHLAGHAQPSSASCFGTSIKGDGQLVHRHKETK